MTRAPAVLPATGSSGTAPTATGQSVTGQSVTGLAVATQSAIGCTGGWHRRACSPFEGPTAQGSCGAVTAEFAVTLPAVLLLLAMLLAGASAGVTQLRLEEGARAGARALARGDDSATVERIVRTLAGGSASAAVSADGEWLHVTVTDRVGGPLGASIPWYLTARASTRSETAG